MKKIRKILIFIILGILIYFVFFSSYFKIKTVVIFPKNDDINKIVDNYIKKRLRLNFLISKSSLKNILEKKFPKYEKIEIYKKFHYINIFLFERKKVYCVKINEDFCYVDKNKVVVKLSKCQPVIIIKNSKENCKLWQIMPSEWLVNRLETFNKELKEYQGSFKEIFKNFPDYKFKLKNLEYDKKNPIELIVNIKNTENTEFKLILNLNDKTIPIENIIYFLKSDKFNLSDYQKLEYFDLRIKNRIIYKLL